MEQIRVDIYECLQRINALEDRTPKLIVDMAQRIDALLEDLDEQLRDIGRMMVERLERTEQLFLEAARARRRPAPE
jgi:hypothetical protein